MPTVLMIIFGFAITNDVKNVRTVVVTSSTDHLTQQAIDRLAASEYFNIVKTVDTPQDAELMIRNQKADIAIVFAKDFAKKINNRQYHSQSGSLFQLIVDGSDPNMAQQWTSYAMQTMTNSRQAAVNLKLLYNPQMKSAYNFVPAIMGMLLMLVCAMMTSVSIVREKERGTMEVLLASPVRPLMIIVAKAVPYLILAFLILIAILTMSRFVFDVPIRGSLVSIVGLSLVYIILALSLGLLISNVADTQLTALLLSAMVLLMPIVMLSGMMFPIESMPEILQWVSMIVPPRYYIAAMRKLMIMGVGIREVAQESIILISMTLALMTLALAKFKKRL